MAQPIVPPRPDRDAFPASPTDMTASQPPMAAPASTGTDTESGRSIVHADGDVLHSAKEQGRQVAAETGQQIRNLYGRAVDEVADQAGIQQKRLANGLYALSDEAERMARAGGESGAMTPVVREAGQRFRQAGEWLERRQPGDVVRDVQDFARQHPGTFLIGAAVIGTLAGRLTKNLATTGSDHEGSAPPLPTASPATTTPPTPTAPTGYGPADTMAERSPL